MSAHPRSSTSLIHLSASGANPSHRLAFPSASSPFIRSQLHMKFGLPSEMSPSEWRQDYLCLSSLSIVASSRCPLQIILFHITILLDHPLFVLLIAHHGPTIMLPTVLILRILRVLPSANVVSRVYAIRTYHIATHVQAQNSTATRQSQL